MRSNVIRMTEEQIFAPVLASPRQFIEHLKYPHDDGERTIRVAHYLFEGRELGVTSAWRERKNNIRFVETARRQPKVVCLKFLP